MWWCCCVQEDILNKYRLGLCVCILSNVFSITIGSSVFSSLICYRELLPLCFCVLFSFRWFLSSTVRRMMGLHSFCFTVGQTKNQTRNEMQNTKKTLTHNFQNKTSALQTSSKGSRPRNVTGPPTSHSGLIPLAIYRK